MRGFLSRLSNDRDETDDDTVDGADDRDHGEPDRVIDPAHRWRRWFTRSAESEKHCEHESNQGSERRRSPQN